MTDEHISRFYTPFLKRLVKKDWFTSRISAASLVHVVYRRLPESEKSQYLKLFCGLCTDDTPMVRRVAAQHLGRVAKHVRPQEMSELVSLFTKLAADDQDSVRIQTISNCFSFADILPSEMRISSILPVVLGIAGDRSWRVRWSLANTLHEICSGLGDHAANNSLSTAYESLLGDAEPEVRAAAAGHVSKVCGLLRKDVVITRIIPMVQKLATDVSEFVRASLASSINDLAAILGKEDTVEHLLPILLSLLRDETSEVRLNVISKLDVINVVVGVELLSQSLLPAIVDLAEDSKWRVRLAIIDHIPMLATQLGSQFFNDKLNNLCMAWLGDQVYSVRRAAADIMQKLSSHFGEDWTLEYILPRIERMQGLTNYLHRITALYGIQVLAGTLSKSKVEFALLPIVLKMSNDPVPNVRFTAAKTLKIMMPSLGKSQMDEVTKVLGDMTSDSDGDVRFYATKALQ